jgi:hypothetical protein
MTNPTARAISSAAVAASACGIAFALPMCAPLALIGLIGGIFVIWQDAGR